MRNTTPDATSESWQELSVWPYLELPVTIAFLCADAIAVARRRGDDQEFYWRFMLVAQRMRNAGRHMEPLTRMKRMKNPTYLKRGNAGQDIEELLCPVVQMT